jgi:hypothetical protein
MHIIGPEAIIVSHLFYPLTFYGRTAYMVEASQRYWANELPMIRDDRNTPVILHEELGVGSVVRLALNDDGLMHAVQVVQLIRDDPFADAA